jgi:release factor glutamine methyltransferase
VPEPWTVLAVLEWTTRKFADRGIEAARLEAQVIIAHALHCTRVQLYTGFDKPLGDAELGAVRELIKRRLAGEPVAYLVGDQEFWSRPFAVDRHVLVPRRDTETVIEVVLAEIGDRARAWRGVDIGTGSGILAVTLARELAASRWIAIDLSPEAAAIAARNATANDVADRVDVRVGDLLAPIAGEPPFDVVVSNPPYVRTADIATLSAEVRSEPRLALDGGADGMGVIRRLVAALPAICADGAIVAIEHGDDQGDAVRALLDASGAFTPAATRNDLTGRPRVTHARRTSRSG